jgi:hypothetical protein
MKNLLLTFFLFIGCIGLAQHGIGIFPVLDNFRYPQTLGYDTTGFAMGKKPTLLYAPHQWLPKLRPTFFVINKKGDRINEFSIDGRYFNDKTIESNDKVHFYSQNQTYSVLHLKATKNVRIWQTPNEKLQFWIGINRGLYLHNIKIITEKNGVIGGENIKSIYGLFTITPQIQYRYNQRLSMVLRWDNPSRWFLGVGHYYSKEIEYYSPSTQLNLLLTQPKLNHNLRLGVRYTFDTPQKDIVAKPIKKVKKWKKTDWGIGATLGFYFAKPTINYGFSYELGYTPINLRPTISIYSLSNDNHDYREFYVSDIQFTKDTYGFQYRYTKNDTSRSKYVPAINKTQRFIIGYGHYKKVNRLSRGRFSMYAGTRLEYVSSSYQGKPNTSEGYQLDFKSHALRLAFTTTALWKINNTWQIETRILPPPYLELGFDKQTDASPIPSGNYELKGEVQNHAGLGLGSIFLLGVKYRFKTTKVKDY